jgi:hypothetical protein
LKAAVSIINPGFSCSGYRSGNDPGNTGALPPGRIPDGKCVFVPEGSGQPRCDSKNSAYERICPCGWEPCEEGNAVDFKGTWNSRMLIKDPDIAGKSFSIEMWLKRGRNPGVGEMFLTQGEAGLRTGLELSFSGPYNSHPANRLQFDFYGEYTKTAATFNTDTGVWHHWSLTFNALNNGEPAYKCHAFHVSL